MKMSEIGKDLSARCGLVAARALFLFGQFRYCVVCENYSRSFKQHGIRPRPNAKCPRCSSLERHRLVWMYFQKQTNLFDGTPKRMLHIAPEQEFQRRLETITSIDYLTADLSGVGVTEKMDITDIRHPGNSFDVIYCSHVLEHVLDDRKAIREFHRVLSPDGWAALLVPITAETTFEDPSITDAEERERLFGQDDHVRRYGLDFTDRLEEAGFHVRRVLGVEIAGGRNLVRMGIKRNASVFACTKQ